MLECTCSQKTQTIKTMVAGNINLNTRYPPQFINTLSHEFPQLLTVILIVVRLIRGGIRIPLR